jgi:hypothetical protein
MRRRILGYTVILFFLLSASSLHRLLNVTTCNYFKLHVLSFPT